MTGHDNGLVTIALAEADDAYREQSRVAMHEPYRTLLGHFRHETGHYFWDRLVRDRGRLEACRAMFGDDRQDYGKACKPITTTAHRPTGNRVSSACTPRRTHGRTSPNRGPTICTSSTPPGMRPLIDAWLPLSLALNSLKRAMGLPDLYPFVLSPPSIMGFVHELVHAV